MSFYYEMPNQTDANNTIDPEATLEAEAFIASLDLQVQDAMDYQTESINPLMECYCY